jgi:selenide,water dikinase
MSTLNRGACAAMTRVGVHAATDVTGFGLLGHLRNVVAASGCRAVVQAAKVPVVAAARAYVNEGIAPGGTHANWRFLKDWVDWDEGVTKEEQLLLCDAQTSGGLLVACPEAKVASLIDELRREGTLAADAIGRLESGAPRMRVQA